jgi:hypothetical protein
MDKLIELLNEYDSNWWVTGYWALFNSMNEWISEKEDLQVISKKFWFIKWLVDNDKIDFDKTQIWFQLTLWYWKYESLLMILSIQDNPIEFLISILR